MPSFHRLSDIRHSAAAHAGRRLLASCCLLSVITFAFFAPQPASGQETAEKIAQPSAQSSETAAAFEFPTTEQLDRWIAELSHDAFTIRQAAASRLLAAGMSARAPLVAVAEGPDPETRAAARRLVSLIDQSEFHRRLEAFAADTDGRRGLTLPGWEKYRASVGGDSAARALFVEMQRHEGPLLSTVFGVSTQSPEQIWEDRLMRLVQWPTTAAERSAPPLGSCAAMLFLGTAADMNVSDRGAMLVENLIQRPPIRETLAGGGTQNTVRRLVSNWILHCPNKSELILARRLNLASMIDLKEALPLALAVASDDPKYVSVPPPTRAFAVLFVGQFGQREHVQRLEPLLEDTAVCLPIQGQVPGQPAASVQLRDVALVVMLHLTGQRPADYGYVHARLQPQRTFQLQTLHRESDEQRAAAVAKWRTWRAAEKSREPEDPDPK
ncbi:MAG: hypothetical protein WD738_21135 [Pirellulales bacterium]